MLDYERRGPVAVVTVDRPERRNAIDEATAERLADAFDRFAADDDADVAVLTGAGGDFSAGADLEAMDLTDKDGGFLGVTRTRVEKPVVAAVEGYCVAGGLELACWCDLRVAASDATFGCFERRFGVPLVDGGTQRLPRIVGQGRALDVILTGRPVDADEALDWGLVDRVVDPGEALERAVALGERIASFPQETVRSDLAAVYDGTGRDLEAGLRAEAWRGSRVLDVAREGAERFARGEGIGGAPGPGGGASGDHGDASRDEDDAQRDDETRRDDDGEAPDDDRS
jgi:enoyl-CoA hydratase